MIDYYRQLLSRVQANPGKYGLDGGYAEAVVFINGVNAGTGGMLLAGFDEWLQTRAGRVDSRDWSALVVLALDPTLEDQTWDTRLLPEHLDTAAYRELFGLLDAFLGRLDEHNGRAKIFADYAEMLGQQGLSLDLMRGNHPHEPQRPRFDFSVLDRWRRQDPDHLRNDLDHPDHREG
jgi:hypothetical protein